MLAIAAFAVSAVAVHADSHVTSQCSALLQGLSASGHSDTELAALCRAAYPSGMCQEMRKSLGSQPWELSRISGTCDTWNDRVVAAESALPADRRMMTYEEFQSVLDASARKKAEYGYELPRNGDGTVDLDGTVRLKFAESQKITKAYNQYFVQSDASKEQSTGLWELGFFAHGRSTPLAAAAASLIVSLGAAAAIGGAVVLVRRVVRRREIKLLPVDGGDSPIVE